MRKILYAAALVAGLATPGQAQEPIFVRSDFTQGDHHVRLYSENIQEYEFYFQSIDTLDDAFIMLTRNDIGAFIVAGDFTEAQLATHEAAAAKVFNKSPRRFRELETVILKMEDIHHSYASSNRGSTPEILKEQIKRHCGKEDPYAASTADYGRIIEARHRRHLLAPRDEAAYTRQKNEIEKAHKRMLPDGIDVFLSGINHTDSLENVALHEWTHLLVGEDHDSYDRVFAPIGRITHPVPGPRAPAPYNVAYVTSREKQVRRWKGARMLYLEQAIKEVEQTSYEEPDLEATRVAILSARDIDPMFLQSVRTALEHATADKLRMRYSKLLDVASQKRRVTELIAELGTVIYGGEYDFFSQEFPEDSPFKVAQTIEKFLKE